MNHEPSWKWRRLAIFLVTTFCCGVMFRLIDAADSKVNELIAYGAMSLIGILVMGYTGFATVQDVIAIWRTGKGMPYDKDGQ